MFDAVRIESGTPLFGVDFDEENLPQEVGRDELAISFTKGCYLGQETVARIDALGHVNQGIAGVRFDGADVPAAKADLTQGDKPRDTSLRRHTPRSSRAPLALAMVRRQWSGSWNAIGFGRPDRAKSSTCRCTARRASARAGDWATAISPTVVSHARARPSTSASAGTCPIRTSPPRWISSASFGESLPNSGEKSSAAIPATACGESVALPSLVARARATRARPARPCRAVRRNTRGAARGRELK